MKTSPLFLGFFYFMIAILLIYFAIQQVSSYGWNIWSYLIVAFATTDILVSIRFFRFHFHLKRMNRD